MFLLDGSWCLSFVVVGDFIVFSGFDICALWVCFLVWFVWRLFNEMPCSYSNVII